MAKAKPGIIETYPVEGRFVRSPLIGQCVVDTAGTRWIVEQSITVFKIVYG